MEVGAIGFHDNSKVKTMRVERDNTIVKLITKTKQARLHLLVQFCISTYVVETGEASESCRAAGDQGSRV